MEWQIGSVWPVFGVHPDLIPTSKKGPHYSGTVSHLVALVADTQAAVTHNQVAIGAAIQAVVRSEADIEAAVTHNHQVAIGA
jgi:hypothetical protein